MAYVYDRSFFDYIDRGARRSAERMLRQIREGLQAVSQP